MSVDNEATIARRGVSGRSIDVDDVAALLFLTHCGACGRVYILARDSERERCVCGCEFYPVARIVHLGEPLRLGGDKTDLDVRETRREKP